MQEAYNAALESLRVSEEGFGKESIVVVRRRMDIATILRMAGNYKEAMEWGEKAVGLEQKIGDVRSVDYAISVQRLGEMYLDLGQDVPALKAFTQSYEVLKAALPEDDPVVVTAIHNLGVVYYELNRPEAKEFMTKALAQREKTQGPDSFPVAMTCLTLAKVFRREANYPAAVSTLRRAVDILRKNEKQQSAMLLRSLDDLTVLYLLSGETDKAEANQREGEEMAERLFGKDHRLTVQLQQRRGDLHLLRGEMAEAEKCFLRLLEYFTKQDGEASTNAVNGNLGIAQFYEQIGQTQKAEQHFIRALKSVEAVSGGESGLTAQLQSRLGDFYNNTMKDWPRAESCYRRALAILDTGKFERAAVPQLQVNLANICMNTNRNDEARSLLQAMKREAEEKGPDGAGNVEGARILLAALNEDSSSLEDLIRRHEEVMQEFDDPSRKKTEGDEKEAAKTCSMLAEEYLRAKRPQEAEKWCRRALDMGPKRLAPTDDLIRKSLMSMVWALVDQNRDEEAQPYVRRWMELENKRMTSMLSFGSAEQRARWLGAQFSCELPVSLGLGRETAGLLLHTKGIIFDLLLSERREAEAAKTEAGRTLWDQLVELHYQVRRETEAVKPSEAFPEIWQRYVALEAKLSELSGSRTTLHETLQTTVEQVQESLPEDAALIDFIAIPVRERGGKWVSRYGGVVVRRGREPKVFTSKHTRSQVDEMAGYFRASIKQSGTDKQKIEALESLHHAFYEMVLEPAEGELEGVKTLYVCPDGALQTVPFATLLDKRDRFLAERFDIRILTSARDLSRPKAREAAPARRSIAIFGEAKYALGTPSGDLRTPSEADKARVAYFFNSRTPPNLFTSLPGAKREMDIITNRASEAGWTAQNFRGTKASEPQFRLLVPPQCLHVATHGYFLKSDWETTTAQRNRERKSNPLWANHGTVLELSLHRAGVLLTGAEDSIAVWRHGSMRPQERDGILDAQEVTELDLRSVQLVVLSACNTDAGSGVASAGALSLRTAFLYAGAQHVVSTLWPIPDGETAEFMGEFYQKYLATGKPCTAFYETQRDCLVRVRKSKGLWQAVRQAGAYVLTSSGSERELSAAPVSKPANDVPAKPAPDLNKLR